jgi:uncharacterized protein YjiS (DUF1127 family)
MVFRTARRAGVRPTPRFREIATSSAGNVARRITTVTLFSRAGMMRQHPRGKILRANSLRERSMQFEKQLFMGKSPLMLASRGEGSSRHSIYVRAENGNRALRSSSPDDRRWRAAMAASSALVMKAAMGAAAFTESAFPNFLFAVMSWTIAQVVTGCAEYARAMGPISELDERIDHRPPTGEFEGPDQPQPSPGARSSATAIPTGCIARMEAARANSPAWGASVRSLLAGFRSCIRQGRGRRLAIIELRALDDRSLRDIGISRCDIEYLASRGDRCE